MLQFKETKLLWLFYMIVGWLYANKQFPKKMEFWQNKDDKYIYCNVYYCLEQQIKTNEPVIDNKEEQIHKRLTNQYPTIIDEHIVSDDMELTDAEKA